MIVRYFALGSVEALPSPLDKGEEIFFFPSFLTLILSNGKKSPTGLEPLQGVINVKNISFYFIYHFNNRVESGGFQWSQSNKHVGTNFGPRLFGDIMFFSQKITVVFLIFLNFNLHNLN